MTKQISNVNLTDVLNELKNDIFASFNCHRIGRINSFDSSKQVAEVELIDKPVIATEDGNINKNYPLLADCPVYINKGTNGGFTRPITVGEYCIVHFNDRDIENWFVNGVVSEPKSKRTHNLTDGLVTVGYFSQANTITDFNNSATEMNYQGTKVSLDSKVGISNDAQDLKSLITQLITVLNNLQVLDPVSGNLPITSATASSLSQLQSDFNDLLK